MSSACGVLYSSAFKMFIRQCSQLIKNNSQWALKNNLNENMMVTSVWVQGVITKVMPNNEFLIDDGSGIAIVTSNDGEVPGYGEWVHTGQYCMVMGKILETSPIPRLAAIKLTDLSLKKDVETLWLLEVIDFWIYLLKATI